MFIKFLFSPASLFLILLFIYLPGISGALYYDDYANLKNLSSISDFNSIYDFVFSGRAGPLGRPIALFSFVPFSSGWPENKRFVLAFNILIHCVNFILIYLLSKLILVKRFDEYKKIALLTAFLWAVLPILASTTLITIQRMTSLAASFGILGLIGFVWAYKFYGFKKYTEATLIQFSLLGIGTVLSVFTKETGALIPIFAFLLDRTIFRERLYFRVKPYLAYSRSFLLAAPLIFFVFYLSPLNNDWFDNNNFRGFSLWERFSTELTILWEYLYRGFFPQSPTAYGPFHDYYGIREWDVITIVSASLWVFIICFSAFIYRKSKWPFFAVFWFLTGHLAESTFINLELYFEHRNYLAMYGVCLALTIGAYSVKGPLRNVVRSAYILYLFLLGAILLSMTSLWGDPVRAADTWNIKHPGSARAVLHAVFLDLEENNSDKIDKRGVALREYQRKAIALEAFDRTKKACPDCIDVRLMALVYSCDFNDIKDRAERLDELSAIARVGRVNMNVADNLFELVDLAINRSCEEVTIKNVYKFVNELSENIAVKSTMYASKILFNKARLLEVIGNYDVLLKVLREAERISPKALPILQYQVYIMKRNGDYESAIKAVERRRKSILKGENENESGAMNMTVLEKILDEIDAERNEGRKIHD